MLRDPVQKGNEKEATLVIDEEGNIQSINETSQEILQTEEDVIGERLDTLIPGINFSALRQGETLQWSDNIEDKRMTIFIHGKFFELGGEGYYLLSLYKNLNESMIDLGPQGMHDELLDIKYALDESTIVAITDNRGRIKYVNDKFCEISKFSRDELLGEDHRIINSGYHEKSFFKELWRTIGRGNVWKGEIKNKAKDGTYYWVDTTIVPSLDDKGKPYQYLAIRHEVTDHKRVVEELRKSLDELKDLKFALDEATIVAITDPQGKINYVNEPFVNVSKYSKEELIGNTHSIINSGYHSTSFFKDLWSTIGTGDVWKGEIRNRAKDGTFYWVDTTIVPFLNERGRPYQYLSIRFEITKRKKVEEELQHTLTRLIEVQEQERKRLSRELHDEIGQNLYSHVITINRLSAELEHPLVEQLLDESTDLIQEVRDFSWQLRPSVLDDLGLVPAIRSFLNRYSDSYEIAVYFNSSLEHRLNTNIEITIYRIIQESLTNIRKYASVDQASVTIRELENSIRVLVEDNGKGFDQEELSSGVGLVSMEERARSVDGELSVNSTPGKGTTVVLDIPHADE